MSSFNPADWYWRADDGRAYSSARQEIVAAGDAGLAAFEAAHGYVTRWPCDDAGDQTDAALAAVLAPYGRSLWPVPLKERLSAYVADKRWQVETGGIVVGGLPVATDDRSKIMIIGARVKAAADGDFTTEWKTQAGFVSIDASTIVAISDAVLAHVDACFAAEAVVLAAIEAGTITTTAEIDTADWPV